MDQFIERMLERTRKRQELLASVSAKSLRPLPLPETPQPSSPPLRGERRNRLAELASRVDLWLENDSKNDIKSNENEKNSTSEVVNKTNENDSTQKPKSQLNICRLQQLQKNKQPSDNEQQPQWQSPNLAASTLTVAQRRALFENNIVAQQQSKKPVTTSITISMKKTTPAKAEENKPELEEVKTPPRTNLYNTLSPPSRRGTRPRASPAMAAAGLEDFTSQQRQAWTPPCIKNVLLKKRLIGELVDDEQQQIPDNTSGITVATSSPIKTTTVSSADRIAMSVGCVRFMPDSPTSSLYPDLSLIENSDNCVKETTPTPLEYQPTSCKRRSNGTSTGSSESVSEAVDSAEMLGAKRSRCDEPRADDPRTISVATSMIVESCPSVPITTTSSTPSGSYFSSILSDHAADSQLSQTCTSFTFYRSNDDSNYVTDNAHHNPEDLIFNSPASQVLRASRHVKNLLGGKVVEPDDGQLLNEHLSDKPALVHTVSTYRKQQQQLRLGGTPTIKTKHMEEERYDILKQRLKLLKDDDDDDDDDEEDYRLQELETVAERARHLERSVLPEQDRIIEQATQALNICDMYRLRSSQNSGTFTTEHVHAERLLLIAGLRRTDAVREAQRLRVERTLLPGGILSDRHLNINDNGKTLVIESLRIPILTAVVGGSSNINKTKFSTNGLENLTRWSGGYRYFVCAIRASATACRPPVSAATRPADAVEESVLRFSQDTGYCVSEERGYGYVEFITKKQAKSASGRIPCDSEGAPIIIHGLDDSGWKVAVELYGFSPINGEHDHHNGSNYSKEHDAHESSKSVLDKLWSTVTTPSKESKKQHTTTAACIESPGGPMAVRNTMFRQLGYFVFSDGQVDRQQFTLNKVHQSGSGARTSRVVTNSAMEETVRLKMRVLEHGEQYACNNQGDIGLDHSSLSSNRYAGSGCTVARKQLTLPSECKRTEGFLTLFDDHELRSTPVVERGRQWQRHSDIGGGASGGTTLWRRLWFRVEIIKDLKQQETSDGVINDEQKQQQNNIGQWKTIVLQYWMYPEHVEQQREPMGAINLGRCLPPSSSKTEITAAGFGKQNKQLPAPAAPALPDLCTRPNTLRLLLYDSDSANNMEHFGGIDDSGNRDGLMGDTDDPLLLAADTVSERREWCDTINAAVRAIGEHREQMKMAEAAWLKQKQQNKDNEQQQKTSAWPRTPGGSAKNIGKKKKFYK